MTQLEDLGNRLWDVADFVKPSQVGPPILLQSADTLNPSSHQGWGGVPGIVTGLAGKSLIGEIAWGRAMKRFWVAWGPEAGLEVLYFQRLHLRNSDMTSNLSWRWVQVFGVPNSGASGMLFPFLTIYSFPGPFSFVLFLQWWGSKLGLIDARGPLCH